MGHPFSCYCLVKSRSCRFTPLSVRMTKLYLNARYLSVAADPLYDAADGYSGRTFGGPGFGFVHPGHAGDVEVNPGGVFGEFLQEHGGRDGSAIAAACVLDVSDVGADLLTVFVVERETPETLAGCFQSLGEVLVGFFVVREDSGVLLAEGHGYGSRQRGGIDQVRCAELFRVG